MKPNASLATWISLDRVVSDTVRLSVFSVTRTPASKSRRMGCSAKDGTALVWTLLTMHTSRGILRSASSRISRSSRMEATPWPMRMAPSSRAFHTLSGPAASPAWIVRLSPRRSARENNSRNRPVS